MMGGVSERECPDSGPLPHRETVDVQVCPYELFSALNRHTCVVCSYIRTQTHTHTHNTTYWYTNRPLLSCAGVVEVSEEHRVSDPLPSISEGPSSQQSSPRRDRTRPHGGRSQRGVPAPCGGGERGRLGEGQGEGGAGWGLRPLGNVYPSVCSVCVYCVF